MTRNNNHQSDRDERLQAILVACIEASEAGQAIDRQALLDRHPEFAAELSDFLSGRADIQRLTDPLRPNSQSTPPPVAAEAVTLGLGEERSIVPIAGVRIAYFGDYELLDEIGRGGMGVVYKARQVSLNRVVALKMILTGQLANDADVKRFHAEAEAAAKLDHPGIVPVFEVGKHEGHHYFSMAFVEGESLAKKLVDGLPKPRDAAVLIKQVAEAVTYAHVEGVVHRDLKPANILIDKNGQPRLTDFGLAKRVEGDAGLTQTGQIVGTPSYMPPEQASGRTSAVGPLSDVYSLGAILYCLLTGRPPFQADNPLDTLIQVLDREPVSPRQLNAAIPRDLETICLKCLEKEPRKRYGSAQELVADLGRYLNGEPIVARPASQWERTAKWVKRRPAAAALIGVSTAAAIALLVGGLVFNAQLQVAIGQVAQKQTDLDQANAMAAETNTKLGEALSDIHFQQIELNDANRKAGEHEKAAQAQAKKAEGVLFTAQSVAVRPDNPGLALLLAIEGGQRHRDLLANQALYDAMEACREEHTLIHSCAVHAAEFSPDGKWALTCGHDGAARLWDVATGKVIRQLKDGSVPVVIGHFSPDGRRVLTVSHPQYVNPLEMHGRYPNNFAGEHPDTLWKNEVPVARLWDPVDGKLIASWWQPYREGKYEFYTPLSAEFSPNSKLVATAFGLQPDGTAEVRDAETGKQVCLLTGHKSAVVSAAFSPDGQRVVTASIDESGRIYNAQTGAVVHELKGHTNELAVARFSPDGKKVLTYGHGFSHRHLVSGTMGARTDDWCEDSAARLWDADTGKELPSLRWPGNVKSWVWSAVFNHDGTRIVTAGHAFPRDDHFSIWDAANGKRAITFKGEPSRRSQTITAVFSPDGRRVASVSREKVGSISDAETGEELMVLAGHREAVWTVEFSRDGRRLITTGDDHTARIWDVADRGGLMRRRTVQRVPSMTLFSADGKWAYSFGMADGKIVDVHVLDTVIGEETAHVPLPSPPLGIPFQTRNIECRWLACVDPKRDTSVWAYEAPGIKKRFTLDAHDKAVTAAFCGPDTKQPRLVTVDKAGKARVWSLLDGKLLATLVVDNEHPIAHVSFDASGERILTANPPSWDSNVNDDIRMCVWDAGTGKKLTTLRGMNSDEHFTQLSAAAFSPDGKRAFMLWTGNKVPHIWNVETGEEMPALDHGGWQVLSAAFSPDGMQVVTGAADKKARIWDVKAGRLIRAFDHESNVWQVEFSADGKRILTSPEWKAMRVWDAASGEAIAQFRAPFGMVRGTFSGDGTEVFACYLHRTGSYSGTWAARIWPLDPLAEAIKLKPRELSAAEREHYGLAVGK